MIVQQTIQRTNDFTIVINTVIDTLEGNSLADNVEADALYDDIVAYMPVIPSRLKRVSKLGIDPGEQTWTNALVVSFPTEELAEEALTWVTSYVDEPE